MDEAWEEYMDAMGCPELKEDDITDLLLDEAEKSVDDEE